ncbi:energy transducer TonB [Puniceicoccales bacterium CK1056]|uniref:Energy transducer TonB n=1 Tax=Oceanipulchritudo coccoides TaxID=2706888 RepID=A0A6B2LXH8_9BACT|nr:energy transducer TonB [Oceanipulchritudo coccoides]NDV61291.1 energy transducer TonB [Oceanipulchritudo coccoides]
MSDKKNNQPPDLKQEFPRSFLVGFLFMAAVLLALPISQLITEFSSGNRTEINVIDYKPPPVMEEQQPPDDDQEEEEIEEIEQNREPPTLEQLELSMSADLSGFTSSDFTVPTINIGDQLSDIIYELEDLTRAPRPISQRAPTYPPELRRAGISGTVVLMFIVRDDGSTSNISVERSDNPAFEEPAVRAVRKWRFEPGEKDGKAVNTRVRIPIPFKFNR